MKRSIRGVTALAIAVAVGSQLAVAIDRGASVANFFSFFTIISNVAAFVLFSYEGLVDRDASPVIRGAIALYMIITGLVHAVLLAPITADVGLTEPWVDFIVHTAAPVVVGVDWFVSPPVEKLHRSTIWLWLVFPTLYLAYALIRGPVVDWYPYPFLDPGEVGGYGGVVLYSIGILVVFLVVSTVLRWWADRGWPANEGDPAVPIV